MHSLRICYNTIEFGDVDIHVKTLRDRQQVPENADVSEKFGISSATWPIFGVIWDAGNVLAHHMFDFNIEGKRILEVGCGIALASLVLNHREADITATDYNPAVEDFLFENTQLNNDRKIPFTRTGWGDEISDLGKFDVIIGSDLLYESEHVDLLSTFINQHTQDNCEVIIVDKGRGHHAKFSKKMVSLGYSHNQSQPEHSDYLDKPFTGQVLCYNR